MEAVAGPKPISTRAMTGATWFAAARVLNRGQSIIKTLVLARLLAPAEFGLFAIVLVVQEIFDAFTQPGFYAALVHEKAATPAHLNTVWTMQAARAVALAGVMWVCAPAAAAFFGIAELGPLLRFSSAAAFIVGFENIGVVMFQRDVDFGPQFIQQTGTGIATLLVAVTVALLLPSVWALMWGSFAGAVVRVFLSYRLHPYRPRPMFDRECGRALFRYGRWVSASTIAGFLTQRLDVVVLARLLPPAVLGAYRMATTLSLTLVQELRATVGSIGFPVFSALQDDRIRTRRVFLDIHELAFAITAPAACGLVLLAPDIVHILAGPKWDGAVGPLRILAAASVISTLDLTSSPVLLGLGRPALESAKSAARLGVIACSIWPLARHWGASGAAASVLLGCLAANVVSVPIVARIGISLTGFAWTCLPGLALSAAVSAVVTAGILLLPDSGILRLSLAPALAGAFCIGCLAILRRYRPCATYDIARRALTQLRERFA